MKPVKSLCGIFMILFALIVLMSSVPAYATLQSDLNEATEVAQAAIAAYDEAVALQEQKQIEIDNLNTQIAGIEEQLPARQALLGSAAKAFYVSGGDFLGYIEAMVCGDNLAEVIANIEAYERIITWRDREMEALQTDLANLSQARDDTVAAKIIQDAAVSDAAQSKQDALDAQEQARSALNAANAAAARAYVSSSVSTARAATSSSWSDEESAKAYIIGKESGGNYQAVNGRYYGAYQLTNTYLNGDYSPENQDRVAQSYVEGRYGSWTAAATFWDSHGWY